MGFNSGFKGLKGGLMHPYTMRDNKFDQKFRKNFETSHLILGIYLIIFSILITSVKVHPSTGYEAPGQERYRFTLSLISTLDGCGWSTPRPGRFTQGKRPDSHCTGGCWAPGQFLTGCIKLAPIGMQSADRPARNEPLYRLRYAGPQASL